MDRSFTADDATIVQRNPLWLPLAFIPLALAAVVAAGPAPSRAYTPGVIGLLATVYVLTQNPRPRELRGSLRVDGSGVWLQSERLLARTRIQSGFVVPRPGRAPAVRLVPRGLRLPVEIRLAGEAAGDALVRALELAPSETATQFTLPPRAMLHPAWQVGPLILFGGMAVLVVALDMSFERYFARMALIVVATAFLFQCVGDTRLEVRSEGLFVRWLGVSRFIPYTEVWRVTQFETSAGPARLFGIELALSSGENLKLPVERLAGEAAATLATAVDQRIREAMRARRTDSADAGAPPLDGRATPPPEASGASRQRPST